MNYLKYVAFIMLLLSLTCYFFGYVPKTTYKKHHFTNRTYFNKQTIDKVVLIVVDSMRSDMVYSKKHLWPNVYNAINQSWAYPTIASLQPPSMSLAKIKCIITGAIVGFIDVMFNTDSGKIEQDNLIDILKRYRKFVINFYGDITWLKLFPNQFNFKDPTTPFFVTDYFQVDHNVSRNIPSILSNRKWDMVIMHYLGLDHIGHAEGPFAQATDDKLSEMDNRTGLLINNLIQKENSNKTLVILTSDHGMSDLGGHGGSSINEITVPLIFFSQKFQKFKNITPISISQNDIAPSLAILLGVPIPGDNIGVIPQHILSLIDNPLDQSKALLSNYLQISKIIAKIPNSFEMKFFNINSSINKIHYNCSNGYSVQCIDNLSLQHSLLINLMNDMKIILKEQFIQHNFILLEISHTLATLSFLISISILLFECGGIHVSAAGVIFIASLSSIGISFLYIENLDKCTFFAFKISFSALMIILTGHSLTGLKTFFKSIIPMDLDFLSSESVIIISLFLNISGSSIPGFIKEENQVWFYLNNTLLLLYLFKEFISKKILKKEPLSIKATYFACIFILITDRFLRTLNRTGEIWSSIPDIGDWFLRKEHSTYLLAAVGVCLPIVGGLSWDKESYLFSFLTQLLVLFNSIHRFADIEGYRMISDISVWIYYSLVVFQVVFYLILKRMSLIRCTLRISDIIFFTSFIVCRHQNLFLWTGIAIKRMFYHKIWLEEIRQLPIILQFVVFNIIGMSTFFQQGNSNSLTTLDVQPGFVGMTSFVPPIIFPVVAIHTFAGNFFWIFTWLEWLAKDRITTQYVPIVNLELVEKSDINSTDETVIVIKTEETQMKTKNDQTDSVFTNIFISFILIPSLFLLPLYVFCVFHKHQIIAWSVYAPKLLYLCFQNGFLLVVYGIVAWLQFW